MTWVTVVIIIPLALFVLYMTLQIASYEAAKSRTPEGWAARRQIEQDLIDQDEADDANR